MEASVIQRIGSGMLVTVQVVADHLEKSYDFSPPRARCGHPPIAAPFLGGGFEEHKKDLFLVSFRILFSSGLDASLARRLCHFWGRSGLHQLCGGMGGYSITNIVGYIKVFQGRHLSQTE